MEANTINQANTEQEVIEKFHKLEKDCIGYDNYVNCGEENFKKTLEELRLLVCDIQRLGIFSPNEEIKEIATENIKLMMAPYYEADVLFRIMGNRLERVKLAQVFYLEYLKLLNHYGVLEKDQLRTLKLLQKKHKISYTTERTDASPEEVKEVAELMKEIHESKLNPYEERDAKVAEFKLKKLIEQQLDELKNCQDEETKREYCMFQIKQSVFASFEQIRCIEMEIGILRHQSKLTPEQIAQNEKISTTKPEKGSLPPLQYKTITKESLQETPYLMRPQNKLDSGVGIVNEYQDKNQRMEIHKDTVDQMIDIRQQYKDQVFRPGFNQPTMTLDELAEIEMADAMKRQQEDQIREMEQAMEDPESEEIIERERQKKMAHENWADTVPKGRGITQKI